MNEAQLGGRFTFPGTALTVHRLGYGAIFPLGGFSPLQSSTLTSVAERIGATPMQIALA